MAVAIEHHDGRITAIQPLAIAAGLPLPLAITPPVDPHLHLDKAFSGASFPNPDGTMAGALGANLRELQTRRASQVLERSDLALERA